MRPAVARRVFSTNRVKAKTVGASSAVLEPVPLAAAIPAALFGLFELFVLRGSPSPAFRPPAASPRPPPARLRRPSPLALPRLSPVPHPSSRPPPPLGERAGSPPPLATPPGPLFRRRRPRYRPRRAPAPALAPAARSGPRA